MVNKWAFQMMTIIIIIFVAYFVFIVSYYEIIAYYPSRCLVAKQINKTKRITSPSKNTYKKKVV